MNEYFDITRRNIQQAVNQSYTKLSQAVDMAGTLVSSTGTQLYSSVMDLKDMLFEQAIEFIPAMDAMESMNPNESSNIISNELVETQSQPRLVSVICGFPKDMFMYPTYCNGQFGEDAWFRASTSKADAMGVADGVGGWRVYGVDPSQFSSFLMRSCERLVHTFDFEATRPEDLLARAYCNLLEQKKPIVGSCTACVLTLLRESNTLYAANIGDSGLLVIRDGSIVCRSVQQQHFFNTPFQLTVHPQGTGLNMMTDEPECADLLKFDMKRGDILVLATDGVYDNVSEELLVQVLSEASGVSDPIKLQTYANCVAMMARSLSFNPIFDSPFAQNARQHNIEAPGGKPDDITVIVASVV